MQLTQTYPLRDMRETDLGTVLAIEQTVQAMPWSKSGFEESLGEKYICRILESQSEIVGFHIVCPVADELHILNLAVAQQHQGHGYAHVLLNDIVELAEQRNLTRLFLEVRASNTVAQSLYTKWQFTHLDLRKGYYRTKTERREDALVLMKELA